MLLFYGPWSRPRPCLAGLSACAAKALRGAQGLDAGAIHLPRQMFGVRGSPRAPPVGPAPWPSSPPPSPERGKRTGIKMPGPVRGPAFQAVEKVQGLFRQPSKIPLLSRRTAAQKSSLRSPQALRGKALRGIRFHARRAAAPSRSPAPVQAGPFKLRFFDTLNSPARSISRRAVLPFWFSQFSVVRDLGPKPWGSSSFRGSLTNAWSPRATSTVRSGANS